MPQAEQNVLIYGPIYVGLATHKVLAHGKPVHLTKMEYHLLCYLIRSAGRVVSRQEILANVWDSPPNVKTRTLDMHIHALRKKLSLDDCIRLGFWFIWVILLAMSWALSSKNHREY